MKTITIEELKNMRHQEGLILQGCGGDLQEWIDGINGILREQGILLDGKPLDDVAVFQHEGLTNLLFDFGEHKLDIGKLAIWRIQTREQFGGTWLSDCRLCEYHILRAGRRHENGFFLKQPTTGSVSLTAGRYGQSTGRNRRRVKDMGQYTQKIGYLKRELDDELVRRLLKTVRVINENKVEIQFQSGIVIAQSIDFNM